MKEANRDVLDRGSLPELLVGRARQASDRRLVVDAAAGLLASAAFVVLRPPLWVPLTALAFCLGAYGIWGILDREASESHTKLIAWARGAVGLMGIAAAVVFGFSLFFGLLGQWIS